MTDSHETCMTTRMTDQTPSLRDRIAEIIEDFDLDGAGPNPWCLAGSVLAMLNPAERQFLTFALDLASEQMASRGDEFTSEDEAALSALRLLAAGKEVAS